MPDRSVLLIISGGVAAYKALDLIRRLRERGMAVQPVLTASAERFVSRLSASALAGTPAYGDLFATEDEMDVGHIRLARKHDLVLIAPATANILAKLAHGLVDDLASAILAATDRPIMVAPAMNPMMWNNPATRRNIATLAADGIHFVGPERGEMAEAKEAGLGRMSEPLQIVAAVEALLDAPAAKTELPLAGRSAIVTSGPTHEPIDPVRYIANRSSGKQGHAIATALAELGASVTLVSGPVELPDPPGMTVIHVEQASQMHKAVMDRLPVDIAVMVAAVADWGIAAPSGQKLKKTADIDELSLVLQKNPDILKAVGHADQRPQIVVGFAAETENVEANAQAKLLSKRADIIVANDVSGDGAMGADANTVSLVTTAGIEKWEKMRKSAVAEKLAHRIASALGKPGH